jgi:periplasmic divalent cation tolerance protein
MTDFVMVLTTMPDDDRADELARALVDERLAACVNVHKAMSSTYRWHETVEHEAERQLVIKTTRDRVAALKDRMRLLHPYEVPELIVIPIADGSEDYLNWLSAQTGESGGSDRSGGSGESDGSSR